MAASRSVDLLPNGDCLEWSGCRNGDGYGKCGRSVRGIKYHLAHRWAWAEVFGDIPDGLLVLHKCDNPSCCNPAHLFLGRDLDNARDRAAKGRSGPRVRRIVRKLTDADLSMAYLRWRAGESQRSIAADLGCHQANLSYHFRRLDDQD